ncbi:Two component system response regulator/histidine kinase, PAS fold-containing [Desulfonema limicola]|uniref:histidine kinase n=1 Tax=Desulfonema limicola TaxID=45656 RepID=A0A975GGB5_9BACT|nr:two-component regulator propeller domain-containing protein [Desulfonema limicola]QTA80083.1 Two component system response regulator/histidine kinase, PAS fold-containing [Desulfonema limicola]
MNNILKILVLMVIINLSALVQTVFSDNNALRFDHLTPDDGLSAQYISVIFQDRQGFIWIATSDGLDRYDGYNFISFRHDPENPNSLSSSGVNTIWQDNTGILWFGTLNGLTRFDPQSGNFKRYLNDNTNRIRALCQDSKGFLWLGTRDKGLYRFDPETETFTLYQFDPGNQGSLRSNTVEAVYEDKNKTLWVGTYGGLERFVPETQTFIHYRNDPQDPHSLIHNSVLSIFEDRTGVLWIGTDGGLDVFVPESETFTHLRHDAADTETISSNSIRFIREDSSGILWIGTFGGGLNRFDQKTGRFEHFRKSPANPHSLPDDSPISFCEDRTGGLWFGTMAYGIGRIMGWSKKFTLYRHIEGNTESLGGNPVNTILEDTRGEFWFGMTGSGLDRYDPKSGRYVHYMPEKNNTGSLSHVNVFSVIEDSRGLIWISTFGGGLNCFNPVTRTFTRYQYDKDNPDSISSNALLAIVEDRENRLWIGSWEGGLNRFDPDTGIFTRYGHKDNDPNNLGDNRVISLCADRTGTIWIGLAGAGLAKYVPETDSFIHYKHSDNDPESLSHSVVTHIFEDRSGTLWTGTTGGGFNRFDRQTEKFRSYTKKDGLPDNTVYGIIEDDRGLLWLSTNKGLSCFDPKNETFQNYDMGDGLQGMAFKMGACFKSSSGELWFGGNNGLNRFHPDNIKRNPHIPPVVLTDFKVSGRSVYPGKDSPLKMPIHRVKEITLSPAQSKFSFEFAALDYNYPKKNRYAYMMEGFDKDWIYTDSTRRFATYTNLSPGKYTFRVKGSNNDGVWNEDGTWVNIIILPPWWKTWWFITFLLLMLVFLLFGGYRLRVNALETRSRVLAKQVADRTHALTQEISERRAVEENLRKSQYLLTETGRMAKVGGWEFDIETLHQTWTEEVYRIHEVDMDFIPDVNKGIDFYAPESRPIIKKAVRLAVAHGKPFDLKLQIITARGNLKWVHVVGKGHESNGRIVRVSGTFQDITDSMLAQQEILKSKEAAEAANRAKSVFLANMSHELRTPLNGILGYVQILQNDTSASPRQQYGLKVIEQSGKHLFSLINDVLDLAKIESGKIELYETEFYLSDFIKSAGNIIRIRAEQKVIKFCTDISDGLPERVRADERRLRQVLLNLLGNAVKFTDKGRVMLRIFPVEDKKSNIRFEVEDTGIGISHKDFEKILDPFQQAGDIKHKAEGTGLGLAISRNLVKLMGGTLEAESKPGFGSRFWFELELHEVQRETGKTAETSRQIDGIKGPAKKILIVDDNLENRAVFRDLLMSLGFETEEAEDGSEGLSKAIEFQPDAVITDLIMPKTDGFELIQNLKHQPGLKNTLVIAASASVYEDDHRKSMEAGADAFLPKPIEADRLFDLLRQFLGIEWQYRKSPDETLETDRADIILPKTEILEKLLEIIETGDVEEFMDQIKELARSDKTFVSFAQRFQKLANGFKLNEIRGLIKEYLNSESR